MKEISEKTQTTKPKHQHVALSLSKSLKWNSKAPKETKTVTQQTINNNRFRDTLLSWPNDQMDVGRPHKINSVARVIYSTFIKHYTQIDTCSWYLVTVLSSSVLSPLYWQTPFGKQLWCVFSCPQSGMFYLLDGNTQNSVHTEHWRASCYCYAKAPVDVLSTRCFFHFALL